MGINVGGRIEVTLNGQLFHPVAEVEFESSGIESEAVVNQDGSVGRSVKTKPVKLNITIRDTDGLNINAWMLECFDLSMVEKETNRSILMTQAFFEGTPSRNTVTGEISGLMVCCAEANLNIA